MKQKFEVNGMSCAACSASVERMVSAINGVSKVEVNLMQKLMICEYDEKITSADEIIATVDKIGFSAKALDDDKKKEMN